MKFVNMCPTTLPGWGESGRVDEQMCEHEKTYSAVSVTGVLHEEWIFFYFCFGNGKQYCCW
jgi:hypothetical protein